MKTFFIYLLCGFTLVALLTACGPSQQEQQQREQARQDSLEQVRQQQAEQQRLDSLAQARKQAEADSLETQRKEEESIKFDPNGPIAVQVEAWRSREKAQQQVSKWKDRGFPNAYVVKHGNTDTGNIWFRVRLGRVASDTMAERLGQRIQQQYSEQYWIAEVADEGTPPKKTD